LFLSQVISETPSYGIKELLMDALYESRIPSLIIGGLIMLLIIPFWMIFSAASLGFCGYAIYKTLQSYEKYGSTGIWGVLVISLIIWGR